MARSAIPLIRHNVIVKLDKLLQQREINKTVYKQLLIDLDNLLPTIKVKKGIVNEILNTLLQGGEGFPWPFKRDREGTDLTQINRGNNEYISGKIKRDEQELENIIKQKRKEGAQIERRHQTRKNAVYLEKDDASKREREFKEHMADLNKQLSEKKQKFQAHEYDEIYRGTPPNAENLVAQHSLDNVLNKSPISRKKPNKTVEHMKEFVKLQPRMFERYRKQRVIQDDTVTGHKVKDANQHRYVTSNIRPTVERQYAHNARSTSSSSSSNYDDVEDDDSEEYQEDDQDDIPDRNLRSRNRN